MTLKQAFTKDAREILDDTLKNGDPFNGRDWSLVQILREYILIKESEKNCGGYFLIHTHKNTIQGYSFLSDIDGSTINGVPKHIMSGFCDYNEAFIPNGEFYYAEQGRPPIPRGDILIFGKLK